MSELKTKREHAPYSAKEKAEAVLALWTERRRPLDVCRELGVKPSRVSHWQERAMEGMLAALEPQAASPQEPKPMLPKKVERLLARKSANVPLTRLSRRLAKLQKVVKRPEHEEPSANGKT